MILGQSDMLCNFKSIYDCLQLLRTEWIHKHINRIGFSFPLPNEIDQQTTLKFFSTIPQTDKQIY